MNRITKIRNNLNQSKLKEDGREASIPSSLNKFAEPPCTEMYYGYRPLCAAEDSQQTTERMGSANITPKGGCLTALYGHAPG